MAFNNSRTTHFYDEKEFHERTKKSWKNCFIQKGEKRREDKCEESPRASTSTLDAKWDLWDECGEQHAEFMKRNTTTRKNKIQKWTFFFIRTFFSLLFFVSILKIDFIKIINSFRLRKPRFLVNVCVCLMSRRVEWRNKN